MQNTRGMNINQLHAAFALGRCSHRFLVLAGCNSIPLSSGFYRFYGLYIFLLFANQGFYLYTDVKLFCRNRDKHLNLLQMKVTYKKYLTPKKRMHNEHIILILEHSFCKHILVNSLLQKKPREHPGNFNPKYDM